MQTMNLVQDLAGVLGIFWKGVCVPAAVGRETFTHAIVMLVDCYVRARKPQIPHAWPWCRGIIGSRVYACSDEEFTVTT